MAETVVPKKIGKYPIIEKVAEGGMGAVYKAKHPTLDRFVIIKKLTILNNTQMESRFRREASIMMDLKHENIVQVYDHFTEGAGYYIVMEYVEGTDLLNIIKRNRYLPNYLAVFLVFEITKALNYAHKNHVIHRDIKPANVLVSTDGKVKLTDFGVASQFGEEDELTNPGMTIGTPAYMAPEQISDPKSVDQKADTYSLGVMFYEMVVGQKPFQGGFTPETIGKVSKGKYPAPRKINPKVLSVVQGIIKKMMHHKRAKRFNTAMAIERFEKKFRFLKFPQKNREWLQALMNGEDVRDDQIVPVPNRRFKMFVRFVSTMLVIGGLGVGGYYGYKEGYHFRWLSPDEFGSVEIVAGVRKNEIYNRINPPQVALYRRVKKKWYHFKNINVQFKELVSSEIKNNNPKMSSGKVFLPKGNYKARIDIANEQFYHEFMVQPWSSQVLNGKEDPQQRVFLEVEKQAPRVPLKLKTEVFSITNNQPLSSGVTIETYVKGWKLWNEYALSDSFAESFVSGKDYSFKISADGFHTKYVNITVGREQTILNLSVSLVPSSAKLNIKNNAGVLKMTANNLSYRFDGHKSGRVKPIPLINKGSNSLLFAQGEYYLSFQETLPWWNRIVFDWPPVRSMGVKTIPMDISDESRKTIVINPDPQNQFDLTLE